MNAYRYFCEDNSHQPPIKQLYSYPFSKTVVEFLLSTVYVHTVAIVIITTIRMAIITPSIIIGVVVAESLLSSSAAYTYDNILLIFP